MTTGIVDLDPQIVTGLSELKTACEACITADDNDAKDYLNSKKSVWEKMTCQMSAEVAKFRDDHIDPLKQNLRDTYGLLTSLYLQVYQPHHTVAQKLHAVYTEVWAPAVAAITPIQEDLTTRAQQTHWKGPGADEYMKQLPLQQAAVSEFSELLKAGGQGVEQPALLQAAVFVALKNEVDGLVSAVKGYQNLPKRTDDVVYERTSRAYGAVKNAQLWLSRELYRGEHSWKRVLDVHIDHMTDKKITDLAVIKGDRWPRATKDTDVSKLPKPRGPLYTSTSPAVVNAPVIDSGSNTGLHTDSSGGGGGGW